MRILWFNWRDFNNPEAGGAEVFTHEVGKRLLEHDGIDSITLFTSSFDGSQDEELVDGIQVIRQGNKYSVYREAKKYYQKNKDKFDIVIDEINTKPFDTPSFVKGKPIIALIHQLAREFWFYETSFPLNYLGYYFLENKWLSHYRDILTITVSLSTRNDLEQLGFSKVVVVPQGLSVKPLPKVSHKEADPTIIFVGRLKRAKLPHHALQAFSILKKEIPEVKMWIVGGGYMREELQRIAIRDVTFFGFVSTKEKEELTSRAHLLIVPAVREGWGLVVTEANAVGTPAVGYDVPGLRDSIRDRETGILVKEHSHSALATAAISLLKDPDRLTKYSEKALEFSRQFSWDKTAKEFGGIVGKCLQPKVMAE
jgi:glycosyltransferase involved in cell wall biosynthesis